MSRVPAWPRFFRFRSLGAALLAASLLAAAGCGQKTGAAGSGAALVAAPPSGATSAVPGAVGPAIDPAAEVALPLAGRPAPASTGPALPSGHPAPTTASSARRGTVTASSGPTRGPVSVASDAAGASGPSAAPAVPPAQDRTGVSANEIVIGVHAPLTGPVPLPQHSLDNSKDLYWKWLRDRGGIYGRNVRLVLRDDQFSPTRALQVCREMAEQEHAFLLVGYGVDQITCARYAAEKGIPYLGAGGAEAGFDQLKTYFALSMSWPAQSQMLVQLIRRTGKSKLGIVIINSANLNDTQQSITAAARAAGLQIVRNSRVNKQADQGQALAEAAALRQAGAEVVYLGVGPDWFLDLAHAAQGQAYNPLWVGPGPTNGLNLVAEFGCPSIGAAKFLSPFPELDVIDRYDTDYRVAYRKYNNGEEADDFGLLVWGQDKALTLMLRAAGPDLSRQRFLATLESGKEFASNVFPALRYGPGRHFGASQAHLLEADCTQRRYRTLAAFASGL